MMEKRYAADPVGVFDRLLPHPFHSPEFPEPFAKSAKSTSLQVLAFRKQLNISGMFPVPPVELGGRDFGPVKCLKNRGFLFSPEMMRAFFR